MTSEREAKSNGDGICHISVNRQALIAPLILSWPKHQRTRRLPTFGREDQRTKLIQPAVRPGSTLGATFAGHLILPHKFQKRTNKTDPPMLQDVGLSLGCNPGRKIQSLVVRMNNNMAVKSTARTCYIFLYHVLSHILSRAGCAVWKRPRASNSACTCPDPNVILSRYLRQSREGNLDCFGFKSRRHVWEPIDVQTSGSIVTRTWGAFIKSNNKKIIILHGSEPYSPFFE
ncbi:uncharacterized protein ARMOST_16787 [Armillaria ostoyae]|uniref:Uncharacterized protein n=1 Tax=Armillaria ostoyae TaxID=47428 RepID=A0A284RX52_ARMOS|nr:uncharacterized protein ARMOST_16787 [Armillaria ostoyae]